MRSFNKLIDFVHFKGIDIGKDYNIIAKDGTLTTTPVHWKTRLPIKGRTNGTVLVINAKTLYLEWKYVYTNTKGYFIKLENSNFYFKAD